MRLDLYQAETAQIASEYSSLLDEARQQLSAGGTLSRLEQNGVLHALQVLIENAIGKAKQILKAVIKSYPQHDLGPDKHGLRRVPAHLKKLCRGPFPADISTVSINRTSGRAIRA